MGAACIRHSLRPPFSRGATLAKPGRNTPREREPLPAIRRYKEGSAGIKVDKATATAIAMTI